MTAANFFKIWCRQVSHQNKEFCWVMCGSEVAFKKLSKIAGPQQIDRQWQGLKSFVFSNSHKKVKTSQGSDVNPAVKRRVFEYVWRSNLKTKWPHAFLTRLAQVLREQRKNTFGTRSTGWQVGWYRNTAWVRTMTPLKLPGDLCSRDLVVGTRLRKRSWMPGFYLTSRQALQGANRLLL